MTHLKATCLGLAALAFAGAAQAQDSSAMHSDSMAKPMHMSAHDMRMMKSCKGMSHDMMMKNAGCVKMMKMHPDMMSGG